MLIALTGTPGTGKTTIASILKKSDITVLSLKEIAETHQFIESFDEDRQSNIVDIEAVGLYIDANYAKDDWIIVEGHLSHLLPSVQTSIVLRCHPKSLRIRLLSRDWSWKKIRENLEAEALDIILCEAIDQHGIQHIVEFDSTDLSVEQIASDIQLILQGKKAKLSLKPGSIDWSESLFDSEIMEK